MFHRKPKRFRRRSNGRNGMPHNNQQGRIRTNQFSNGQSRGNFRSQLSAEKSFEKYTSLAKEAMSAGDKTLSENYLQHAEHFMRIIEDKNRVNQITSLIGILGLINVPIIKFSVDWWSTLHQNSSVNILSDTSIHPSMLVPLLIMTAAFSLFSLLIFLMKYNTELIKIKNKGLDRL